MYSLITGTKDNTDKVDKVELNSSQIALEIQDMKRGLGEDLTKIKDEIQALEVELEQTEGDEEREKLKDKINALNAKMDKTFKTAYETARYDL